MKKSILWLASYPKSGNTWMRMFLANYLTNAQSPVSINQAHRFALGDSIPKMYSMVAGREIDVHNLEQTLALRDRVLTRVAAGQADVQFVKTHNICAHFRGVEMIPDRFTRSAIYILRNPLDMVLSYARHYGQSHEDATHSINRSDNANAPDHSTVWQFLGSWSDHVNSWTKGTKFPVHVVRYEDLLQDPVTHFTEVLRFIGMSSEKERIERAIQFSSFKELKKQEEQHGFVEKSVNSDGFFGTGTSDKWKTELSPELVKKIKQSHKRTMKQFGYYNA